MSLFKQISGFLKNKKGERIYFWQFIYKTKENVQRRLEQREKRDENGDAAAGSASLPRLKAVGLQQPDVSASSPSALKKQKKGIGYDYIPTLFFFFPLQEHTLADRLHLA